MPNLDLAVDEIRKELPELRLTENEPMRRHCSFRIGGPVRALALPSSDGELIRLVRLLRELEIAPLIIGNGTNLLITDEPLARIAVKLGAGFDSVDRAGALTVTAGAGVTLSRLANFACVMGMAGLEFAHGIPGTLGGAVSMNAGAYGGEMKDVVSSTIFLDETLARREISGTEHGFEYRRSIFSDTGAIILRCLLKLASGETDAIHERMSELSEKRRNSQPLDMPSAGSTFKRPVNGYAAALIEEAGLKGCRIGGAAVSDKHAGFIVNTGGAEFADVLRLIEYVKETVYENSGVKLEPEIKIITNSAE